MRFASQLGPPFPIQVQSVERSQMVSISLVLDGDTVVTYEAPTVPRSGETFRSPDGRCFLISKYVEWSVPPDPPTASGRSPSPFPPVVVPCAAAIVHVTEIHHTNPGPT